jgi:phosphatidylserine decarboxylase
MIKRSRAESSPLHPETVKRRMVGQLLIDRLVQLSGPLSAPVKARLESAWLAAIAHPSLSKAVGRLADERLPRPVLDLMLLTWVKLYDVDLDEAELPLSGYPTLDAFFTRRLKPHLRPIDPREDHLVSCADSVLKRFGAIDPRNRIPEVKGRSYGVSELLADAAPAFSLESFSGGTYGVYYLSPRDYHRVHCPCDATLSAIVPVHGSYYPVNALAVRKVERLFARNIRTIFVLDTAFGRLALVMVGATNVGRITASASEGQRLAKGDELGIFHLGSTVVLLTPKSAALTHREVAEGEFVRVGQAVLGPA